MGSSGCLCVRRKAFEVELSLSASVSVSVSLRLSRPVCLSVFGLCWCFCYICLVSACARRNADRLMAGSNRITAACLSRESSKQSSFLPQSQPGAVLLRMTLARHRQPPN